MWYWKSSNLIHYNSTSPQVSERLCLHSRVLPLSEGDSAHLLPAFALKLLEEDTEEKFYDIGFGKGHLAVALTGSTVNWTEPRIIWEEFIKGSPVSDWLWARV